MGSSGHYSIATLPDVSDVPPVVETNLWGLRRLGTADLPKQGLDCFASYGSGIGNKVRHERLNAGRVCSLQGCSYQVVYVVNEV